MNRRQGGGYRPDQAVQFAHPFTGSDQFTQMVLSRHRHFPLLGVLADQQS
ncbi:MAG: hypothetical protein U1F42_02690 [Candidatus Competibacteraceae bacterium]